MEKFYIVWNPEGANPPKVTFKTLTEAIIAAENLANRIPAQRFYVLESQAFSVSEIVPAKTHLLKSRKA